MERKISGVELATELPLPAEHNVTIVGVFNPAILNPEWVMRFVRELPDGEQRECETYQPIGGVGSVVYKLDDIYWEASNNRLRVFGKPSDTGPFAAKILRLLPHTPLSAAGVNFRKFVDVKPPKLGPFHIEVDRDKTKRIFGGEPVETSMSQACLRDDGVRLTLKVVFSESDSRALLDFNFHLKATESSPYQKAGQLGAHAERSIELVKEAERVIQAIT